MPTRTGREGHGPELAGLEAGGQAQVLSAGEVGGGVLDMVAETAVGGRKWGLGPRKVRQEGSGSHSVCWPPTRVQTGLPRKGGEVGVGAQQRWVCAVGARGGLCWREDT